MKKLAYISLIILLLIGLTGCGLPQNVKAQENQALAIVKTIQLPPSFYSPTTGNKMVATPITVRFEGYNSATGEPLFEFRFWYVDPKPQRFLWWTTANDDYDTRYYLHVPESALNYNLDSYGLWQLSLTDLQKNESYLTWTR
jgi:hypothetical protein